MPELCLRGGELDGIVLHFVTEGSGAPVLLLHGLGGFAAVWRHNIPVLGRHATAIALDLPGFGRSSKPPGPYPLGIFARTIEAFRRALGLDRLTLVGHSMGGAVAAAYALEYPSRVERLALVGGAVPGFGYRVSWVYRLLAARGLGEIAAGLMWPGLLKAALARCFARPDPDEIDFLVRTGYAVRVSPEGRAAFLSTLRSVRADFAADADRYRRGLMSLPVPVLLIHGSQDRVVPPAHARTVAAHLRNATVRWLEGCGHFPQIERRDAVNGWLAEFLLSRAVSR
ncbi:MAG: alpha/beta fold hydrolase [Candidatus Rokubacteria bacterium]|nr:alpha/beta fold hydrolase [Candidatus Rokubacteria bacterium]